MTDKSDLFDDLENAAFPEDDPSLVSKMEDERGRLEKLLEKIPGLKGYAEKERRREADQLLRQTIADRLEESRLALSNVHQALSADIIAAMDHAEPLGRADTRLMGLIGKIADAPAGYSGFFSPNKIREDDLDRIYAFDEKLMGYADDVAADVEALQSAVDGGGDIAGGIRTLSSTLQEANNALNERAELLSGFA